MAEAGVELAFDMTQHSVIGLWEAVKNYGKFKRLFDQLVALALERRPDVVVCVDFSGFNRRFARAIRWELEVRRETNGNWKPKIVQYVSPQVWASRPGRAKSMARDFDLLLAIFPFEKAWYAERVPELKVEFVGHPMIDRFASAKTSPSPTFLDWAGARHDCPVVLLLPGSRPAELERHFPVMLRAAWGINEKRGTRFVCVLPGESFLDQARALAVRSGWPDMIFKIGELSTALRFSDVAIASTGTVTMECAFFGVPTIALYKTSWSTYQIGRRIIQVKYLAMPNLLANETIFPELIQHDASAENVACAALDLLYDPQRIEAIRAKLAKVVESLGGPGASQRAAQAILQLL